MTAKEKQRLEEGSRNSTSKWATCDSPECVILDRYLNIQPWVSNRVKLRVPEGENDYVNASPITLDSPDRKSTDNYKYIAMQGPKENTVCHTWRLVWEQMESPAVVVMLTDMEEAGKEKCYQYFPKDANSPPLIINEHDEFGDGFKATLSFAEHEETEQGDAIEVRKLILRVESPVKNDAEGAKDAAKGEEAAEDAEQGDSAIEKGEETTDNGEEDADKEGDEEGEKGVECAAVEVKEKIIWHLLYTRWPDFGVPAVNEVDSFFALMELSRAKNTVPGNPRIVHCSAGVGRSGTFITLEHLIGELEAGGMVYYGPREPGPTKPKGPKPAFSRAFTPPPQFLLQSLMTPPGTSGRKEPPMSARKAAEAVNEKDLVFETVDRLRQQRKMMVQADSQYQFIYRVLKRCWEAKYKGEAVAPATPKSESQDPFN